MSTWLGVPADHPFGLATLPYGVFSSGDPAQRRVGVRIGEHVLDAGRAAQTAGMESGSCWERPTLNPFLALGPRAWAAARSWLGLVLSDPAYRDAVEPHLLPLDEVTLHLPVEVGDYVDFYASEHHASNVGRLFRPDSPALPRSWRHLPIGYHGRSGTVVVSGTEIVRPSGQRRGPDGRGPVFGPTGRLDIEAELGYVVGGATVLGSRVPVAQAAEHLFGVVLLNDWSARDIQAWESVPLGPFLGKSFATTVSAWVTPMAALAAARVPLPGQEPEPLPYLRGDPDHVFGLDVRYEVRVNDTLVSTPSHADMYWSPTQMLAHLTVNGASLRDGDLFGSGTISGATTRSRGSLQELTWDAAEPVRLDDGSTRGYLEDGDTVTLTAWAPGPDGERVGLGEATGTIRPARP